MEVSGEQGPYRDALGAPRPALSDGPSRPPRCAECRDELALGAGATVTCPACGTLNEIPPEHVALREERARDDAARAAADPGAAAAIATIAPPSPRLSSIADTALGVGLVLVLVSMIGWFVAASCGSWIAARTGVHPIDVLGGGRYTARIAGIEVGVVTLAVGAAWAITDWRDACEAVLAPLAAVRSMKGAPACRACMAPLDPPARGDAPRGPSTAGGLTSRCLYCRAENVQVGLPPRKGRPKMPPRGPALTLTQLVEDLRASRRALVRPLWKGALWALVLGSVPCCGAGITSHQEGGPWWRELGPGRVGHPASSDGVIVQGREAPAPYCFPRQRRGDPVPEKSCGIQMAMRRGETSTVEISRASDQVSVEYFALDDDGEWTSALEPLPPAEEGTLVMWRAVSRRATFVAPYDGWFVLVVFNARKGLPKSLWDEPRIVWSVASR